MSYYFTHTASMRDILYKFKRNESNTIKYSFKTKRLYSLVLVQLETRDVHVKSTRLKVAHV